jgi:hypothetical protein
VPDTLRPQLSCSTVRTSQIWLRRERRKIKRVKEVLGESIEDLKRQLAQAK